MITKKQKFLISNVIENEKGAKNNLKQTIEEGIVQPGAGDQRTELVLELLRKIGIVKTNGAGENILDLTSQKVNEGISSTTAELKKVRFDGEGIEYNGQKIAPPLNNSRPLPDDLQRELNELKKSIPEQQTVTDDYYVAPKLEIPEYTPKATSFRETLIGTLGETLGQLFLENDTPRKREKRVSDFEKLTADDQTPMDVIRSFADALNVKDVERIAKKGSDEEVVSVLVEGTARIMGQDMKLDGKLTEAEINAIEAQVADLLSKQGIPVVAASKVATR